MYKTVEQYISQASKDQYPGGLGVDPSIYNDCGTDAKEGKAYIDWNGVCDGGSSVPNGASSGAGGAYSNRVYDTEKRQWVQPTIPLIPSVKPLLKEFTCATCAKSDVCSIKEEFTKSYNDIKDVALRTNVHIETVIKCQKYLHR